MAIVIVKTTVVGTAAAEVFWFQEEVAESGVAQTTVEGHAAKGCGIVQIRQRLPLEEHHFLVDNVHLEQYLAVVEVLLHDARSVRVDEVDVFRRDDHHLSEEGALL